MKNSLAIAYAMNKKKKCHGGKMAEGGDVDGMSEETSQPSTPDAGSKKVADSFKKAFHAPGYAKGGEIKGVHEDYSASVGGQHGQSKAGDHARWAYAHSYQGDNDIKKSYEEKAKDEHHKVLEEMKSMKGHDRKYLAEGGEVDEMASGYEPMPCEKCGHVASHEIENQGMDEAEDMISRLVKKHMYSKGGKVSNEDMPLADSKPAEYDELEKDDDLEFHDTGANSGDEIGDEAEDEDRHDVVSRIMKSRKKKDKMPRPA